MQQKQSAELTDFTEAAKAKGISDEFLTELLVHQGWPKDEVFAALGSYWERATGLAVPNRTIRGEASRDAFLYLLSFATLATWASALGSMLFQFIENWFPDPVVSFYARNLRSAVTWQMASTAVAFPIFLLVTRAILTEARNQPERLQSGVRKWLTYIALLLTAGGLIGDLICVLDYFLTGELTVRFVLKALTVLLICAAIFFYYLDSLRWDKENDLAPALRLSMRFGVGSAAILIAAFCVGLGLAGTPSVQRHLEADKRRVQDLRAIAISIHSRFMRSDSAIADKALPSSLGELVGHGINSSQTKDPETGKLYEFRPGTTATYQLCTVFSEASEQGQMTASSFWNHGKGQTCFALDGSLLPSW